MPYTAGSQGAETNCAAVFMATLDARLIAAGYAFVEQVSTTGTARVYRSPAASNFFGSDWYLIVIRTQDSGSAVYLAVCELYNPTTHVCTNYAPSAASGLTPTAQFAVNDPTGKAPDNGALQWSTVGIAASGFGYWLSITPDRVVVATRAGAADSGVYAGLYDDMQAAALSPFPLLTVGLDTFAARVGAATREPGQTANASNNFSITLNSAYSPWTRTLVSELYTQKTWLTRGIVTAQRNNSSVRGLLRDVWLSPLYGVNGDTLSATIAGASRTLTQTAVAGALRAFVDQAV